MCSAASVLVPYFGQLFLPEAGGQLDQCRPETAMHIRNLAFNQLANEDVGTRTNRLCRAKDLFSFRMAPPTAPDGVTGNRLRQIWKRATGSLENNSVTFNKCQHFLLVHQAFLLSHKVKCGLGTARGWLHPLVRLVFIREASPQEHRPSR